MVRVAAAGDSGYGVVVEDEAASFMLSDLYRNYILLAVVDEVARRRILKFSYEDAFELGGGGVLAPRVATSVCRPRCASCGPDR